MRSSRVVGGLLMALVVAGTGALAAAAEEGTAVRVRRPAVQGQFYPADKAELTKLVDGFLSAPAVTEVKGRVRALISPHAGYVYSGPVAGQGFRLVPTDTKRVVILALSHRVSLRGGGTISDVDVYQNALGDVPIDAEAARLRRSHPFFGYAAQAEEREHSLEVMLPFLQRRLTSFTLVPIILGHDFDTEAVARALEPLVADPGTFVVASTDLSHYHPYDEAVKMDKACVEAILRLDTAALTSDQLCGQMPVTVLLQLAKLRKWTPVRVDYRNSGDTAGDKSRVVGYGCVAFTETEAPAAVKAPAAAAAPAAAPPAAAPPEPPPAASPVPAPAPAKPDPLLPIEEQKALLALARNTIVASLAQKPLPDLPTGSDTLKTKLGCFVTLHKQGDLRGCIGNILPTYPLAEAVQKNALSAAFEDPRFQPVGAGEMAAIDIEISVLTRPHKLEFTDGKDLLAKLRPNIDGVVLSQGGRRSTFLPQVWEQLPVKEEFLQHLCRKGGMAADSWADPTRMTVEVYQAFVFGEKELGIKP